MLVRVLGCREASDPLHANSSIVVEQGRWRLVIDLGDSAAQQLQQTLGWVDPARQQVTL
ncbi:hypothetical protein [Parendozoicomonas sp. Alg238-R29]|uniref:hypothetical protein n=1 Tax=Parendozoicomonas sp. Alg238-R29 TaxID=2993446 RepID=UPI00248E5F5F|nr:hypothetical protein [Parendozoicomonas sp. Alg238-R29]